MSTTEIPAVTGSQASAVVTWVLDLDIEPGSVPDRPVHARAGVSYRPTGLHLEFMATVRRPELRSLHPGSEPLITDISRGTRLSACTLHGPRIRDGHISDDEPANEPFFSRAGLAPGWVHALIAQAQADLELPAGHGEPGCTGHGW
jgi:hypothetical protein